MVARESLHSAQISANIHNNTDRSIDRSITRCMHHNNRSSYKSRARSDHHLVCDLQHICAINVQSRLVTPPVVVACWVGGRNKCVCDRGRLRADRSVRRSWGSFAPIDASWSRRGVGNYCNAMVCYDRARVLRTGLVGGRAIVAC